MKRPPVFLVLAGLSLLPSSLARADVLANYSFTTNRESEDAHELTTASILGYGSAGTNWAYSSAQDNVFARGDTTAGDATSALIGSYFTFTLALGGLSEGEGLNLTSLTFDSLSNAGGSMSGTAQASFFVRSSLDGFATNIGETFSQDYFNGTTENPVNRVVDLSAYQSVTASSIEFRVYVFDDTAELNRTPRLDNVVLNGEVASLTIPEPAAGGVLMAAGVWALALCGRRRGAISHRGGRMKSDRI